MSESRIKWIALITRIKMYGQASSGNGRKQGSQSTEMNESDFIKLQRAFHYLQSQTEAEVNIRHLALVIGMSETKLKEGFKKVHGTTIHRCHLTIRLQKAHELLQETNLGIREIAALTGFARASNFAAAFRQMMGKVPSEVRKGEV